MWMKVTSRIHVVWGGRLCRCASSFGHSEESCPRIFSNFLSGDFSVPAILWQRQFCKFNDLICLFKKYFN